MANVPRPHESDTLIFQSPFPGLDCREDVLSRWTRTGPHNGFDDPLGLPDVTPHILLIFSPGIIHAVVRLYPIAVEVRELSACSLQVLVAAILQPIPHIPVAGRAFGDSESHS